MSTTPSSFRSFSFNHPAKDDSAVEPIGYDRLGVIADEDTFAVQVGNWCVQWGQAQSGEKEASEYSLKFLNISFDDKRFRGSPNDAPHDELQRSF